MDFSDLQVMVLLVKDEFMFISPQVVQAQRRVISRHY